MLLQPGEEIKAVGDGHFQICDNEGGERKSLSILKFTLALKEGNRLLSIAGDINGLFQTSFFKGPGQQKHIIIVIFDNQAGALFHGAMITFYWNSLTHLRGIRK